MCELVVTVKQGKLRGGVVQGVLGPSYIAFHDIPFAAPPIGKLRFKVKNLLDLSVRYISLYIVSMRPLIVDK